MTTPTSLHAYKADFALFDRALESKNGIEIEVADRGAAYQLKVRLHTARQLDRALNRRPVREPEDPKFGRSEYDGLMVTVRESQDCWVVAINRALQGLIVREISDEDAIRPHLRSKPLASGPTLHVHNLRRKVRP